MEQRFYTGFEPQILTIGVATEKQQQIRVVISDPSQKNTVFTNRYNLVNGNQYFYVRMPLAPKVALVSVYDEAKGPGSNDEFSMIGIGNGVSKRTLERKMAVVDIGDPYVKSFVDLAQRFSYNAGWLTPGNYKSDDGKINISYQETLKGENDQEASTPARIGEVDGIIEVSAKMFRKFTVPMRMAILCHEFAHYYRNSNAYNEVEADLQGLLIYLGLGFPRVEAQEAFVETFTNTPTGEPTELNARRMRILKRFINDFETHKFLVYD